MALYQIIISIFYIVFILTSCQLLLLQDRRTECHRIPGFEAIPILYFFYIL